MASRRAVPSAGPLERVQGLGPGHHPPAAERLRRGHGPHSGRRTGSRPRSPSARRSPGPPGRPRRRPQPVAQPSEQHGVAEDGRVEAGRHRADDLAAGEDHAALDRRRAGHGEAEQAALVGQARRPLQRPLAEEVGLVHLDGPVHPDPPGRGVELGVLAHDDVALLQPQPEEGLQAVGPDAEVGSRLEQGLPQLDRGVDAVVQLEAGFAREGEPHEVAVDPRDGLVTVLEEARRVVDAEPAEELGRARGPVTLIAPRAIVRSRTCTRRPHVSSQSRTHISAADAPPEVKVRVKRVSSSRQIMPSSMMWPRSFSRST